MHTYLVLADVPYAGVRAAVRRQTFVESVRLAVRERFDAKPSPVVRRIKAARDGPGEHGTVEVQTEIVMLGGGDL